jgi:hypothetical protein
MMPQRSPETVIKAALESPDFSVVQGGPLFQLFRRWRLSGDALELLRRRILIITAIAWLPLALLSIIDGRAFGDALKIPFVYDIDAHVRFLVALPMLIVAELVVHRRIGPVIGRFVQRRIIVDEDLPKFTAAVAAVSRARNSIALEVSLLVFVYTVGLWLWRSQGAVNIATWYAVPANGGLNLTLPGYWYAYVSIPIFQFLLLRWYMRIVLWFRLLWQISRMKLHLTAAHPDRAGELRFLGKTTYAFAPILFAQGALLSGWIANRVIYDGQDLISFKMEAAGMICVMVLVVVGPLVMFTPMLDVAKRKSSNEYALLANRYVFGFEEKWIRGGAPDVGELLGSGDIQSLADLGNSYSVVSDMRIVPFSMTDVGRLAASTAAPLVPLTLTIFSFEEVVSRLFKILI